MAPLAGLVRDQRGRPTRLSLTPGSRWGYGLEFDAQGRSGDVAIDFEAVAAHLLALAKAAAARGVSIRRVYFDPRFQPKLRETSSWRQLQKKVTFSTSQGWWRHDEHHHVDFAVPCRPR